MLAGLIRSVLKDDSGKIAAAIIDGEYQAAINMKPVNITLPPFDSGMPSHTLHLAPSMTDAALLYIAR
jgi:hypothetical protein